jgi:hypothetical protein
VGLAPLRAVGLVLLVLLIIVGLVFPMIAFIGQ